MRSLVRNHYFNLYKTDTLGLGWLTKPLSRSEGTCLFPLVPCQRCRARVGVRVSPKAPW